MADAGSFFDMEDVKATFEIYSELPGSGTMAYMGQDEMVVWLGVLGVESSLALLGPLYSRSGILKDEPISWEQLLYILKGHEVCHNVVASEDKITCDGDNAVVSEEQMTCDGDTAFVS